MKKYITTDKHPELKEGITVELNKNLKTHSTAHFEGPVFEFCQLDLDEALAKGYIKEVEQKEFTKSEMIDFANSCINDNELIITEEHLNIWRP